MQFPSCNLITLMAVVVAVHPFTERFRISGKIVLWVNWRYFNLRHVTFKNHIIGYRKFEMQHSIINCRSIGDLDSFVCLCRKNELNVSSNYFISQLNRYKYAKHTNQNIDANFPINGTSLVKRCHLK